MSHYSPDQRLLPGSVTPPPPHMPDRTPADTISLSHLFGTLRRRWRAVVGMTVLGAAAGAFLASKDPPSYQAKAVIRFAGERRQLTSDMERQQPEVSRSTDPILSLVQLVTSRSVMGSVVDSLGLQLVSATPEFPRGLLGNIRVDPRVSSDSVKLEFSPEQVKAQLGGRQATGRYGEVLSLGAVQFSVASYPDIAEAMLSVIPREFAIDALRGYVFAAPRSGTDIIDVMYTSNNPRLAQQVVNSTVKAFQELNIQSAREKSQRRREFLEQQFARTDSMLSQAQAELAAFRSRQQIASTSSKLDAQQAALLALDSRRTEIEADRNTFATLLRQLKNGNDAGREEALRSLATSPALGDNAAVGALFQRLTQYQFRLDSMTTGEWAAAPTNPDVVQLKSLIKNTQAQLTSAVSSHVSTLDARIASLGTLSVKTGQSMQVLPAMAEEEARLAQRVEALSNVGDQLRQDYQKARMAEAVEAGDVDVVDYADLPYTPILATASIKFGIGLILGLLLGGGLAFLLEALNTSIRRPEDLESALHLPGLAVIPRLTAGSPAPRRRLPGLKGPKQVELPRSEAIGTVAQPFSIGTEAFRMLRTSLIWSDGADHLKTLVVTSAAPGEGKTLTAANLAASFAHDGLHTLLVDCDVRRPKLHGLFRVPRTPGLLDLLAPPSPSADGRVNSLTFKGEDGSDTLEHVIRSTPIRGLSLLTCGALPTNASNLLSGVRMRALLQELTKQFDLVILDTPPVLATADAGILGSLADGVLLVVRAGQTDRSAAQRAYHQLANVGSRVLGAVLNDPKGEVSQYGDYYYPYEYVAEKE
jgi:polysaccharide biosynthesis transport protein